MARRQLRRGAGRERRAQTLGSTRTDESSRCDDAEIHLMHFIEAVINAAQLRMHAKFSRRTPPSAGRLSPLRSTGT